ncbi:MAG: biotin/lipoyl-containing protein, partial [Myxococcota bacterium]
MAYEVLMPKMGESIAEGTVVKWLKAPGEPVKKDENLLLISTDKVEAEIPAPHDGVLLDILVPEGETVAVDTVLGHVGAAHDTACAATSSSTTRQNKETVTPATQTAAAQATPAPPAVAQPPTETVTAPPTPAATPVPTPQQQNSNRFISPLVRRIAGEHHISEEELASLTGSGQGGRVTKKDLLAYIASRPAQVPSSQTGMQMGAVPTQQTPALAVQAPSVTFAAGQSELQQP